MIQRPPSCLSSQSSAERAFQAFHEWVPLDPRRALAPHLRYAPFVAGDVITREGAVAHWLYLIISGTADVSVATGAGPLPVGRLESGDLFGELGLLSGSRRSATVTARSVVV